MKQIKGTDSLGSVISNDLCIHPNLKFLTKFRCLDFEKYDGKSCQYDHLKVYSVVMKQYRDNDKAILNLLQSLIGAVLAWFTKIGISKNKRRIDLAHLFIQQYEFNSEIVPTGSSYKE